MKGHLIVENDWMNGDRVVAEWEDDTVDEFHAGDVLETEYGTYRLECRRDGGFYLVGCKSPIEGLEVYKEEEE